MKAYGNYSALKLHLEFFLGGGGVSVLCVGNFLIFWGFFWGGDVSRRFWTSYMTGN